MPAPPQHRLSARRSHLRGQPFPATPESGCFCRIHKAEGLNRLPPTAQARKPHGSFEDCAVGFIHVDVKHLPKGAPAQGGPLPKLQYRDRVSRKRYLWVATERASRYVHLAVKGNEAKVSR